LLVCRWLAGAALADGAPSVGLLVRETAAVERELWPVSGGVVLPEGLLPVSTATGGSAVLTDTEGTEIPCQTRVLAQGPAATGGGPCVRRLLVTFVGRVAAGAEARYELRWSKDSPATPDEAPQPGVSVVELAGATVVRNGAGPGAMMLVVDGHRGCGLFESVAIDEAGDGFTDDLPLIGDRRPVTSSVSYAGTRSHQAELGFSVPEVVVEESGPVRAVVRVRSEYDERVSMVHRLVVYAGLRAVFVQTTLYATPGRPQGEAIRVFGHTNVLPLGMLESPDVTFGACSADAPAETRTSVVPGQPLVIRSQQGSTGFSATLGGDPLADVAAPLGWVEAACRGRRVALCLGSLPARPAQRVDVGGGYLVADSCASELSLAPGQSLTEEWLLYFPADLTALEPADAARALADPLCPIAVAKGSEGLGGTRRPPDMTEPTLPTWGEAGYETRLERVLASAWHQADEVVAGRGAASSAEWVEALLWAFGQTGDPRWLGAARGLAIRLCDRPPPAGTGWRSAVAACAELTGDGRLLDALRPPDRPEP